MADYGVISFKGGGNTRYAFTSYSWDSRLAPKAGAYIITRRFKSDTMAIRHEVISIGTSRDFSKLIEAARANKCYAKNYANCVCLHSDSDTKSAEAKVKDLLKAYKPPC